MKRLLLPVILVTLLVAGSSPGAVIVVDCSGGGDHLTLREGIESAAGGDTVLVASGVYTGPDNRNLDYAGKSIVVISESGPQDTVIDCGSEARAFDFHSAEPMVARLSGFTITNGAAGNGGAVFCRNGARPTIDNCVLTLNQAAEDGGALSVISSAGPILENVTFSANEAGLRGGAICTAHGRTVLNSCSFTDNSAPYGGALMLDYDHYVYIDACDFADNSALEGGAIFDYWSSPQITSSTFTGNRGTGGTAGYRFGGAVSIINSDSAVIGDCIFEGNEIHGLFGFGGGLSVHMARATVTSCVFSSNTATGEEAGIGGGVYCYNEDDNWGPASSFDDCTFIDNRGYQGGGVCCEHTGAPIRRCTFIGNEAHVGGGAHLSHHPGPFSDCVVAENSATYGGGLSLGGGTNSVSNTTVARNAAPEGSGVSCGGSSEPQISNSVIALNRGGVAVWCSGTAGPLTILCCDIYGNDGGDWVGCIADFLGADGNISEDPLFCGAEAGDFTIDAASPCAPDSNPECGLIGALGVDCETTAVRPTSWGAIKSMFR
jgi:predicted outer membrane repeat protein